MKKIITASLALASIATATAQCASETFTPIKPTDRTLYFSTIAQGKKLPILWGLDTAWPDEGNIVRGVRFIGAENIGVARVSFQPWDYMPTASLTERLEKKLQERLRLVSLIGGPGTVQLVLNNDGPLDECDERYFNAATDPEACKAYCNLIYGTMLSCQDKGWTVITASPLNEPDYVWNGQGSMDDFLAIARMLKSDYPQFKDGQIRISGGNTLNCDQAEPWYTYLYDYIDEGNTHQLAGDFDHYADFFTKVRADGKYATADELHNVMEAMVGVEYGMQTGIWWGTAEYARGEFCKASFGERLAYAENRKAWSSAAVYRNTEGKIQGFVGQSERQADVCTYRFVSQDRDVFYNGHGPQREYVVDLPGGKGYQLPTQTNAECVIDITWGEDVSPVIDGNYMIMNKATQKVMATDCDPANLVYLKQYAPGVASVKVWEVKPTPITIGGDFSYYTITVTDHTNYKLDVINWSLSEGSNIILYDGDLGCNEQWYLKYAGDGYFRILSRHSNLCLELAEPNNADGIAIVQKAQSESPSQLWRLIPADAACELEAPEAPSALEAVGNSASITLNWSASQSNDIDQYYVIRAISGTDEYTTVGRGLKECTFTDNTIEKDKEYTYKVKAIDKAYNSSDYTSPATATATATGRGLVARYEFNKSLADATANHFDAAAYEGSRVLYGKNRDESGNALNLATKRFVQLPYRVANSAELTVGAWIKLATVGGTQTLFDFGADTEHFVSLRINNSGMLEFIIADGDYQQTLSGGTLDSKDWHHVAVTIAKDRAVAFIDGELVASGTGCSVADLNPVLNYIGTGCDRDDSFINARISDLCIYHGVVADQDIAKMMDGIEVAGNAGINTAAELIRCEYYNMQGVRIDRPASGIYIVKRIYDNGKVKTTKESL